jgi:hypothetical protein
MDTPSDPGDERLERRLRLGIRLVFYPLALGLIAFAWHARHRSEAPARALHLLAWSGRTAQGQRIQAVIGDDGRLASLFTRIKERCSDGSTFTVHWSINQSQFAQDGDAVNGRQGPIAGTDYDGKPVVFDTRIQGRMGAHPQGTLTGHVTWTPARGTLTCRSGPVTFTLRRGSLPPTPPTPPPPATPAQHRVPQPR